MVAPHSNYSTCSLIGYGLVLIIQPHPWHYELCVVNILQHSVNMCTFYFLYHALTTSVLYLIFLCLFKVKTLLRDIVAILKVAIFPFDSGFLNTALNLPVVFSSLLA